MTGADGRQFEHDEIGLASYPFRARVPGSQRNPLPFRKLTREVAQIGLTGRLWAHCLASPAIVAPQTPTTFPPFAISIRKCEIAWKLRHLANTFVGYPSPVRGMECADSRNSPADSKSIGML